MSNNENPYGPTFSYGYDVGRTDLMQCYPVLPVSVASNTFWANHQAALQYAQVFECETVNHQRQDDITSCAGYEYMRGDMKFVNRSSSWNNNTYQCEINPDVRPTTIVTYEKSAAYPSKNPPVKQKEGTSLANSQKKGQARNSSEAVSLKHVGAKGSVNDVPVPPKYSTLFTSVEEMPVNPSVELRGSRTQNQTIDSSASKKSMNSFNRPLGEKRGCGRGARATGTGPAPTSRMPSNGAFSGTFPYSSTLFPAVPTNFGLVSNRSNFRIGGHNGRGGMYKMRFSSEVQFVPMDSHTLSIDLKLDPDNLDCFHGIQSVFSPHHTYDIVIDNLIFNSVDHYYQYKKVMDLCGIASEKITAGIRNADERLLVEVNYAKHKPGPAYSHIAKEQLRLSNIDKIRINEWRVSGGLEAMQKAFIAKTSQCSELRDKLIKSGEKIIVHCFVGDTVYGSGAIFADVKKWCGSMKENGSRTLKIPGEFPLTSETVKNVPYLAKGRNVLGVILMQLRNMVAQNKISISNQAQPIDSAVTDEKEDSANVERMEDTDNMFMIGGGSFQPDLV